MSRKLGQVGEYWLSRNRHGTWCRTWFDARRRQTRRISLGTSDFEAATLMLAQWVVLNESLDKEDPSGVPVIVVLDRYYARHAKGTGSGEMAKLAIGKLKRFFADDAVSDLTLDRQHEFEVDLRRQGLSDGYIARIQTVLKAAVNRSHRNHEISSAPYVRVVSAHAERERILTLEESAALFNAGPAEHIHMLLMLLFNTLARPGALLELRPFQVDLHTRLIQLNPPGRPQTKKRRPTLPVTDTLLPWLQIHAKQRYYVCWTKDQAAPIRSIKTSWRRLRGDAEKLLREADPAHQGLADVVPYTIRHSMATWMRRRGVPEWEVSGFLGHRIGRTTERYSKYAPDYLGLAADAIDEYFHQLQPLVKRELVLNVTAIGKGKKA